MRTTIGTWCSIIAIDSPKSLRSCEQRVAELLGLLGSHPGGRLVQQEHVRVGREDGRELDALQVAVREPGDLLVQEVAEAEEVDEALGAVAEVVLGAEAPRVAEHPGDRRVLGAQVLRRLEVVADGHALHHADVLERAAHAERGALVDAEAA